MKNDQTGFLYLTERDLSGLGVTPAEAADRVEKAVLAQARGDILTAPKSTITPGDGRYLMSTLSVSDDPQVVAVKSVVLNPRNAGRDIPVINATMVLLDSETGALRAVLDANWITAIRTAALSSVVARRLADPRSADIAFIGSGVQALSHLDAFADLFPLKTVTVFGRGRANIDRLCAAARDKGLVANSVDSAGEALEGADIVVSSITATYDGPEFLNANRLKPGAFATITDLGVPWIKASMAAFNTIIIDDLQQEAAMPKPMVAPDLVLGDLAGFLSGGITAKFLPDNRCAFVFRGVAIGDFALAALAYEKARSEGIGQLVGG